MNRQDYCVQLYVALLDKFNREGLPADGNWSKINVTLVRKWNNTVWPKTVIQYKGKALTPNNFSIEGMIKVMKTVLKRLPTVKKQDVIYEPNDTVFSMLCKYPTLSIKRLTAILNEQGYAVMGDCIVKA